MRRIHVTVVVLGAVCLVLAGYLGSLIRTDVPSAVPLQAFREIKGEIQKGETLFEIFRKHNLDVGDLHRMRQATAGVYRLRELRAGRDYRIVLNGNEQIDSFRCGIDNDSFLSINRAGEGFYAEKVLIPYEKRILHVGGTIRDSLIASLEGGDESLLLALQLSDIFAWDIDFTTDLRNGDAFRIVVEGLYLDGRFKKFGNILSAEFVNNGQAYRAYGFAQQGKIDYYDEDGKSLRRAFLKTPLSFRRISSGFSRGRYHPILKIVRPHQGLDYAAASGTPVSAAGDGTVLSAGRRGQYGNLVVIKHRNGYKTYYGHLSGIAKGVRGGAQVGQGSVIGYVGATGLATGPHLHYEMRVNDRPINPLSLKVPPGAPISGERLAAFRQFTERMVTELASVKPHNPVAADDLANRGTRRTG